MRRVFLTLVSFVNLAFGMKTFLVLEPLDESNAVANAIKGHYPCNPAAFSSPFQSTGEFHSLTLADPEKLCSVPATKSPNGIVLFAQRGDCWFVEKTDNAWRVNNDKPPSALVVVNNVDFPKTIQMEAPDFGEEYESSHPLYDDTKVPSCMISKADFAKFSDHMSLFKAKVVSHDNELFYVSGGPGVDSIKVHVKDVTGKVVSNVNVDVQDSNRTPYPISPEYAYVQVNATAKAGSAKDTRWFSFKATDKFVANNKWVCTAYRNGEPTSAQIHIVENGQNYTHVWTKGDDDLQISCQGAKHSFVIQHGMHEYLYFTQPSTYEEAWQTCHSWVRETHNSDNHHLHHHGSLASIHSIVENSFIDSLIPDNSEADEHVWIGLIATQRDYYMWDDYSRNDFVHWGVSEPTSEKDLNGMCVAMFHAMAAHSGTWYRQSCDKKLPFVCKRFSPFTDPDKPPHAVPVDEKCFLSLTENPVWFMFVDPPKPMGPTTGNMCAHYDHERTCCSAEFVNNSLVGPHKEFTDILGIEESKQPECASAIADLFCYPCSSSQADYFAQYKDFTLVTVCEETCIALKEACPTLFPSGNSIKEACLNILTVLPNYSGLHIEFQLESRMSESDVGCFMRDHAPPRIVSYTPANQSEISFEYSDYDNEVIKFRFNEPVVHLYEYPLLEIHRLRDNGEWVNVRKYDFWVEMEDVYYKKDLALVHLASTHEKRKCVFHKTGTYRVNLKAMSFVDMAGNAFHGLNNRYWYFDVTTPCENFIVDGNTNPEQHRGHHHILVPFILIVLVVVVGLVLLRSSRNAVRRRRDLGDVTPPEDLEGQTVRTEDGLHQVRLVPIFDPSTEADNSAGDGQQQPVDAGVDGADKMEQSLLSAA